MDYEKYYKIGNDGTYTIHFPNKKGFSIEEIREIFSSYGNVLSVNISGDINGFRFIRYKTLDEVISCLKGLQNSNDIRILPQKDKINTLNKRSDQKNSNQWQTTRTVNSSPKTPYNKQFNANSTHNEKFSAAGGKTYNRRSFNDDNRSDADNFSDTTSSNSKHSYKSHINAISSPSASKENGKHLLSSRQQNSFDCKISNQATQQETKFYPQTKPYANINGKKDILDVKIQQQQNTTKCDKIPELISDSEIKEMEITAKSGLSAKPLLNWLSAAETKNVPSKSVIIPMQEVIVANIHKDYGVHYILHLFEKYDPIAATLVKTISETDIRYCNVYFKTAHDALSIEEEFDNFVLSERNLIVLRKSRLTDASKWK